MNYARLITAAMLAAAVPFAVCAADDKVPDSVKSPELDTSGNKMNKTVYLETLTPKGKVPPLNQAPRELPQEQPAAKPQPIIETAPARQ